MRQTCDSDLNRIPLSVCYKAPAGSREVLESIGIGTTKTLSLPTLRICIPSGTNNITKGSPLAAFAGIASRIRCDPFQNFSLRSVIGIALETVRASDERGTASNTTWGASPRLTSAAQRKFLIFSERVT